MTSAFISIPVYEKDEKIINLLRTRGLSKISYWTGHFLFDITMFCINSIIVKVFFTNTLDEIPLWLLFTTGCSLIIYAYCGSMIFEKLKTANTWFTVINMLFSMILLPLVILSDKQMLEGKIFSIINYFKYLIPYYDLSKYLLSNSTADSSLGDTKSHTFVIGYNLLLYFLLLAFF